MSCHICGRPTSVDERGVPCECAEEITALRAQCEAAEAWKESAMAQAEKLDIQAIGKAIGTKLGSDIAPEVMPTILALKAKVAELEAALNILADNFNAAGTPPRPWSDMIDSWHYIARQALTGQPLPAAPEENP